MQSGNSRQKSKQRRIAHISISQAGLMPGALIPTQTWLSDTCLYKRKTKHQTKKSTAALKQARTKTIRPHNQPMKMN
jgi:hypothetical protein